MAGDMFEGIPDPEPRRQTDLRLPAPGEMFAGIPDPQGTPEDTATAGKLMFGVLGLVCLLFAWMYFFTPRTVEWKVVDGALDIKRLTGHAQFPLASLDKAAARVVDFDAEPEFQPRAKVMGYNGFGFRSGHFRLANGTNVELDLGNEHKAVLIPRWKLRPLLVGTSDPAALMAALR